MQFRNTPTRYGSVAQTLHWVIAGLIVVQYVLAEWADAVGETRASHPAAAIEQLALLARHKSVGLTIFALALLRLIWRWRSPPPPLPAAMPRWQHYAAHVTHYGFYALLFGLPISGLVMSAAANYPVSYFGLFTVPDLVAPDDGLKDLMHEVHETLFGGLAVLASVHVVAALKHRFVDHDDVLARMVPWRSK